MGGGRGVRSRLRVLARGAGLTVAARPPGLRGKNPRTEPAMDPRKAPYRKPEGSRARSRDLPGEVTDMVCPAPPKGKPESRFTRPVPARQGGAGLRFTICAEGCRAGDVCPGCTASAGRGFETRAACPGDFRAESTLLTQGAAEDVRRSVFPSRAPEVCGPSSFSAGAVGCFRGHGPRRGTFACARPGPVMRRPDGLQHGVGVDVQGNTQSFRELLLP